MTTYQDVVKAVLAKYPKGTSLKEILPEASKEWKRVKAGKHPTKGMASLTKKGREDFTTKKSSKVFHRKGKYQKTGPEGKKRRPFRKTSKKSKNSKDVTEDIMLIDEEPMAGGAVAEDHVMDQGKEQEANLELAQKTGDTEPNSPDVTVEAPGLPTESNNQEGGKRRRHRKLKHKSAKKGGKKSRSRKARKTHKRRRH